MLALALLRKNPLYLFLRPTISFHCRLG